MRKEKIYSLSSLYRENMDIYGYRFGKGEKAACIVGAMRGNEIQQMYIGALLVKSLKELGVSNFDVAFVCTGDVEASIMITLNLKELGIEKIIAKANSKSHGKVLAKIGATKVIYPEEYSCIRTGEYPTESSFTTISK